MAVPAIELRLQTMTLDLKVSRGYPRIFTDAHAGLASLRGLCSSSSPGIKCCMLVFTVGQIQVKWIDDPLAVL